MTDVSPLTDIIIGYGISFGIGVMCGGFATYVAFHEGIILSQLALVCLGGFVGATLGQTSYGYNFLKALIVYVGYVAPRAAYVLSQIFFTRSVIPPSIFFALLFSFAVALILRMFQSRR